MTTLISYCSHAYKERGVNFFKEAEQSGYFDTIRVYNQNFLDNGFTQKYKDILDGKYAPPSHPNKGGGYWIWKPYIILQELKIHNSGDIIVYADAGCTIQSDCLNRMNDYKEILKNRKALFFSLPSCKEINYCNRYTLEKLARKYKASVDVESDQRMGTIMFFEVCEETILFFEEICNILSEDPLIITDFYDNYSTKEDAKFIGHRHDQSITSVLSKIKEIGISIPDETYGQNLTNIPIISTRRLI